MKFIVKSSIPIKDLDLCLYGIVEPTVPLTKGFIFEIPDKETELINRIKVNGNYEVYVEPKKFTKPKKKRKRRG